MLAFPLLDELPAELNGLVYDFWWDHKKLHALELPLLECATGELLWQLDLRWWQYRDKPFRLTPRQVWESPDAFHEQYQRTLAADLAYPIIVREAGERKIIIDGIHRLLKAAMQSIPVLQVAIFSDDLIPHILHEHQE